MSKCAYTKSQIPSSRSQAKLPELVFQRPVTETDEPMEGNEDCGSKAEDKRLNIQSSWSEPNDPKLLDKIEEA